MVESIYTQGIIDRLNHPELKNKDNPFRIVLDGTVGEYLENYDNHILDLFLTRAKGKYLDIHGEIFGMYRREGEDDESFRERILLDESIVQSTSDFLKLDIGLWVYRAGVTDNNVLTSRNPYLKDLHDEGYIFICSGADSEYIQSKFLVNDILWVD